MEFVSKDTLKIENLMFKCEFNIEKKDIKEYAMSQTVFKVSLIIIAFLLVGIGVAVYAATDNIIATIIIGVILVFGYIFIPTRFIKLLYSDFVSRNKGTQHISFEFADKIYDFCEIGVAVYDYQDIASITNLKNLYVIKMKNNSVMIIKKDSFSQGDCNNFFDFINKHVI